MEHQFKKKYGQNFLKNQAIVEKIVNVADIKPSSLVIEVGPGAGILTRALSSFSSQLQVVAYEIDDSLENILLSLMHDCSNVQVYFQDFLQADLSVDLLKYSYDHLYFVSNVPYYITTPILFKLMDSGLVFEKIVMMVQKEVGNRFSAKAGKKEYGALTVLLNYYFIVRKEFLVDRNQFVPRPNVDSVVVSFAKRNDRQQLNDEAFFRKLVHDSFQYKRKTIRNNLKNYDLDIVCSVLKEFHYDLNVRAEQLDYTVFVALANALS